MKLLVITVRGLQARALGAYGNRWIETSCLNALAAAGVVFDQHFAIDPEPGAARRVWRSGRHLSSPGVDLLTLLHHQNLPTRLIVDHSRGMFPEFEAGWDQVDRVADTPAAAELAHKALRASEPSWLIWLDLAALIPPWNVPQAILNAYFSPQEDSENEDEFAEEDDHDEENEEDNAEDLIPQAPPLEPLLEPPVGPIDPDDDTLYLRLQETYAAAVSYVDGLLGDLLDGLADDVHLILTSDHGLALGEHAQVCVTPTSLHQEIVQIPLLIYGPGCRAGRRVEALTGSIDLAPTIAQWAGTSLKAAQGLSLVPLLAGGSSQGRDYLGLSCSTAAGLELGLRTADWSLRLVPTASTTQPFLFTQPDDASEVNNLAQIHFATAEALERTVRAYFSAVQQQDPFVPPPLEK